MRKTILAIAGGMTTLLAYLLSAPPAATATWGIDRAEEMPDLTQTDRALGLPNGGVAHCVPVSATNAILWLGRRGYPQLLPLTSDTREQAAMIANTLSRPDYMGTDPERGTSHLGFARGLERFLDERGYSARIAYEGRWPMPDRYTANVGAPTFSFITGSLEGDAAVWLSIGFYAYDHAHNEYVRKTGHLVTLVGFGLDADGRPDRDMLIVHNSWENRNGRARQQEYLRVEPLLSGWFVASSGPDVGAARAGEARDHLRIVEGIALPDGTDVAIVDAALTLSLR